MQQPNIIFFLVDDMGWKDLTCTGSEFYETPNIDRLAAEGMRFTNAYASCPVCSPTRASILTGKYPATVGVTDWIDWGGALHPCSGRLIDVPYLKNLPTSEYSIAKALAAGGYATWHVGKWHCGGDEASPEKHGFQVNVGGCHHGSPGNGGYFSPWSIEALQNADVPEGTYLTDYLTDQALNLIQNRDRNRPFFLNMWYYSVHTPIQAKPDKIRKYEQKAQKMGLDTVEALIEGEPFPCEHKKNLRVQRRVVQSDPVYAAMIESLDENIGRLLEAIDEAGEAENTLVIFYSDNGGLSTAEGSPTCNLPLAEGKGWMYEGGTREPLLVRWPGQINSGSTCEAPVTSPDFYPTLLEVAGLEPIPEQHCDGETILPLLKGGNTLERDAIFWHYPHYGNQGGTPGSSVRCGDYKLIEFFEDGRIELYNLRTDPGEQTNLADSEPERRKELHGKLIAWRKKVEAKIPAANPDWKPALQFTAF
ncbi:MAG: sulfatase [Verrucomicrobiota bacterium]